MNAAWLQAALPDPPTVCLKLKLRPYSIGHELLLRRFASPFVNDEPADIPDLLLAALICSQPFRFDWWNTINWQTKIFLKLWRLLLWKPDVLGEMKKFVAYREAGRWFPDPIVPRGTKELYSPSAMRMLAILMSEFHLTVEQALDFPMATAHALYCSRSEMEGKMELDGGQFSEMFALARAMKPEAN